MAANVQRARAAIEMLESPVEFAMLRLHGDRQSLIAALMAHWADQQLGLSPATTAPPHPLSHTSDRRRLQREPHPAA